MQKTPMTSADLPSAEQKTQFVRAMFDGIAHRYDLVNRLMTFGLDRGWRKSTIHAMRLPKESLVLDLGCGTGDLTRVALKSGFRCIGVDLSFEMLAAAHSLSAPLVEADATCLPLADACIAGVVSGFALRNFTDQRAVLFEIARVLIPGGRLAILEVDRPRHAVIRIGHRIWFNHVVPKIGAIFSVAAAYRYLPQSVTYLPSPAALAEMLGDSGFETIERRQLQGGLAQIVTATKVSKTS
jgi:demethylmenaquinone methyltransferase/2-methoxy-6-polyprenyl-1,4-benzoquinol methylase